MNVDASFGAFPLLFRTTSEAVRLAYTSLFELSSALSAPPERLMPANTPCAREYDSTSALRLPLVLAPAERPTGPAAIDASAPSDTLLFSIFPAASRFMTSRTRSISSAPAWKPQLPFSRRMKTGALQLLPLRQLITPRPYSPPKMKAAFFIPGMTTTHWARFQYSSGMPSDCARNAVTTPAASLN